MSRAFLDVSLKTLLSAAVITALAACNREPPPATADAPAAAASAPVVAAAPYQRPTAEQLYALVAPIALFPDNLVAQTLAASTHPDQVDDARQFVQGNRNLTGAALIDAADSQPWDPSVKSLVAFPAVLDQMANNGEWTGALGQAYANDPSDVMNAIQVMRSRAQAKGNLKSTKQQTVQVVDRGAPVSQTVVEEDEIVGPPAQTIEIEPTDPGVVYVPEYDPDEVYGGPVYSSVYETRYVEPGPDYGNVALAGVIGFGTGILVGELFSHHEHRDRPWGWDSWHTSWGGHRDGGRPAVVYDNHPYVVNRTVVNNRFVDRSVHVDNRHDFGNTYNRPGPPPRGPQGVGAPPPRPAQPDYAHMQRPTFAPGALHATAPNARPALPPPRPEDAGHRESGQAGAPGRPSVASSLPQQRANPVGGSSRPMAQPQQLRINPAEAPAPRQREQHSVASSLPQQRANPVGGSSRPMAQPQQPRINPAEAPAPRQREQHSVASFLPQERANPVGGNSRPMAQPQQREIPRQAPRPQPQQRPEPQQQRPQPQEHHEQPRPAPQQQQHHDDHKKHDN